MLTYVMNKTLSEAIRESGYKRVFIASSIGVSRAQLWNYEKGSIPRLDVALRLQDLLKKPIEEIFPQLSQEQRRAN